MDSAHSVSPPGWAPTLAAPPIVEPPASAPPAAAPVDRAPDDVIGRRFTAAIMDNVILYGVYLGLCAALGWKTRSAGHLVVLGAVSLVYFFVMESRDGQTIGKRMQGIRVATADGATPGRGAIALRTALRLLDAFPVAYVSGLVTMMISGPARRQRIGDRAGRTFVVPVDRDRPGKASARWLLPTVTILAVLASAGTVLAVVDAGNQPLSAAYRAQFISGCRQTSGGAVDCGCLLDRLVADGYTTPNEFKTLTAEIRSAQAARDPGAVPPAFVSAAIACRAPGGATTAF